MLNNKDNWKREDINKTVNAGEVYTTSFKAPHSGKWRIAGVFADDDWNVTDFFIVVEV